MARKIGLIVNPIAGIGGPLGWKGTDLWDEAWDAIENQGGLTSSAGRALVFLRHLENHVGRSGLQKLDILVLEPPMFLDVPISEVASERLHFTQIELLMPKRTGRDETIAACRLMQSQGAEIILFVGGDGTATDCHSAIGDTMPMLGIPAGVKVFSGCFASSPRKAAELVTGWLCGDVPLEETEVLDIDEELYRQGTFTTELVGFANTPFVPSLAQGSKLVSTPLEEADYEGMASTLKDAMQDHEIVMLGPGGTVANVSRLIGVGSKTKLGVDCLELESGKLHLDQNEQQLAELCKGRKSMAVLSPIGGQGFLLGRGNLQISCKVINAASEFSLCTVSSSTKLNPLDALRIDLRGGTCRNEFPAYARVIIGLDWLVMKKIEFVE